MNRIETIAPEVVDLIDRASLFLRHKILVGVCATAIEGSQVEHELVSSIFNEFRENGIILARMRKILRELAGEFDAVYEAAMAVSDSQIVIDEVHVISSTQ